jgi:hypothetical protein
LKLNSDELGKKGEARFSEICSDAKLVRNPSTDHDRTGWDFIVEFDQLPPQGNTTLDTRRSPLSSHVQVKTMWNSNDRFRMRLSAAERLAKEPKPAFVYVFKVDNDLNFVSAHLVHMLDENLAAVLKRLRREEAKGTNPSRINRKYISFQASRSGRKIVPTGDAFRRAVSELCGSDLDAYIEKKRAQLETLGFEARRFQMTTTFKVESVEGFVDGLLGLRELEVTAGQTFETRFGIKLSVKEPNFSKSVMRIQPGKADSCIITVREAPLAAPAVFSADMIFPPVSGLPKEHVKFLVKAQLFRLLIDGNKIQFSADNETINAANLKIDDWLNFFRMLVALCHGAEMTIKPQRLGEASFPLKFPDITLQPVFEDLQRAFEAAQRLLRLAGAPEPVVNIEGIAAIGAALIKLDRQFSDPANAPPIDFAVDWPPETPVPDKMDFLYVNYVQMLEVTLAHYSVAEMVPQTKKGRIMWKSETLKPCEITFIRDFPDDYERFADRAKRTVKVDGSMIAEPHTSRQPVVDTKDS